MATPQTARKAEPYLHVQLRCGEMRVRGDRTGRVGQVDLPETLRTGQEIYSEWQLEGRQVTVRSCRFGFAPLFYFATEDQFGVSGSLQQLIECGAPTDLDDDAVATFIRLGWLVGNDTIFRSIRMVPPNARVCWSGGAPDIQGSYWLPAPQRMSRAAAVEGYGELFRQAIRRRSSTDVVTALPLSGGRDSRHILLELKATGSPPSVCLTTHDYPPFREANIRIAKTLCGRLEIPHRVIEPTTSRWLAEVRKNEVTNFAELEGAWGLPFFQAAARWTSVVYDGLAGDALSADAYLREDEARLMEKGDNEAVARRWVERWSWRTGEEALERILPEHRMRRFNREMAVQRVARELALHAKAANPMSSFGFWNRTRRCGCLGPLAIAPHANLHAITPYLDHDLYAFLAALPAEIQWDRSFHTETIHRMHPAFRDVPFDSEVDMPLIQRPWQDRRFLAETAIFLALRGRGSLVNRASTVRRLLGLALSRGDNLFRRATSWTAPLHVVYLTQVEALCRQFDSAPADA